MPILSEKTINSHTPSITGPAGGPLPIWKPLHLHKVVRGGGRERETYLGQEKQISATVQAKNGLSIFSPSLLPSKPRSVIVPLSPFLHSYPLSQAP